MNYQADYGNGMINVYPDEQYPAETWLDMMEEEDIALYARVLDGSSVIAERYIDPGYETEGDD